MCGETLRAPTSAEMEDLRALMPGRVAFGFAEGETLIRKFVALYFAIEGVLGIFFSRTLLTSQILWLGVVFVHCVMV